MTIIGGSTWNLQLITFVHVPFSPPLLLILAFQLVPILCHTIVTEGHYIYSVFYRRVNIIIIWDLLICIAQISIQGKKFSSAHYIDSRAFKKVSRAELFDCGVANDMSKVTHVGVHCVDRIVFVLLVQFALLHLKKINFVWLCQRLVSLSFKKTTVHISL